jgi:hypothetical protein
MQKKSKNDNFLNFFKSDLRSAKSLPAAGQPAVRMKAGQGRLREKFQFFRKLKGEGEKHVKRNGYYGFNF